MCAIESTLAHITMPLVGKAVQPKCTPHSTKQVLQIAWAENAAECNGGMVSALMGVARLVAAAEQSR